MSTAERPQVRYTYADYLKWADDERWEIIEGVPYAMTPAPGTSHQAICLELSRQLATWLRGKSCRPFIAPVDVLLCTEGKADKEIENIVQPDIVVVCDKKKIEEGGIRGAPDCIIEIASKRTANYDLVTKTALYQKFGVREYWMVRPYDRTVMILVRAEDGKFAASQILPANGRISVSVIEGFEFDLDLVFETPGHANSFSSHSGFITSPRNP